MRRKCEVDAVPDAATKLLSFRRFRAAAGAQGAPHRCAPGRLPLGARGRARKHVVRDAWAARANATRGLSSSMAFSTARHDVGGRTLRHRVTPLAVGRCPPPRRAELLDRANFHKYNFFVIVRQRASREDEL